jgi:hypothetical protein
MKLNEVRTTHIEADKKLINVNYYFTKDSFNGKPVAEQNVWAVMSFIHPETRQNERLKVLEPVSILRSAEDAIHAFVEREVECFLKDCEELYS